MIRKIVYAACVISVGLLSDSCSQALEKDLIKCDIRQTGYPEETVALEVYAAGHEGPDLMSAIIRDSLVISQERSSSYLFSINGLRSGELKMMCCRKGRAGNEPVSAIPVRDVFEEDGDMKAYVYSYQDSEIFEWNISKSLSSGSDVYDRVVRISAPGQDGGMLALMSCYALDGNSVIVRNSRQDPQKEEFLDVPVYETYSLTDGMRTDVYDSMFSYSEVPVENESFRPKYYLSGSDCISPDRSRIAYVMGYMPYLVTLDLGSGESVAFRLTGEPAFNPSEERWCFTSVQADDTRIYALYYGGNIDDKDFDACPDKLYVFDWNGRLLKKIRLDRHFTDLSLDVANSMLYLTHRMRSGIYGIDTKDI